MAKKENNDKSIEKGSLDELKHYYGVRPDNSVDKASNSNSRGGVSEGYQPTQNISGLPPGADSPGSEDGGNS